VVWSSCVSASNNIYCIGGAPGAQYASNLVYHAPILASNALGAWVATTNFPSNIDSPSCVSYNQNIYCIGGDRGTIPIVYSNTVYYAPVLASNALGSWTSTTNYPANVESTSCVLSGSNIYCVAGNRYPGTSSTNTVYYAPVQASNALGSWTAVTNYPANVAGHSCVSYNQNIYCMGGNKNSNGAINAVYYAPIQASNALGSWTSTTNYPNANVEGQSCARYSNTVFCVGGYMNMNFYTNAVYYAPILASNALGSWTSTTPYPANMYDQACTFSGNNLYCVGGSQNVFYTNAVYWAYITGH
jgi:N-acetylneuraminic acid mutarotase